METKGATRSTEPLLARLKAGTQELHRRIEGVLPLLDPRFDRRAYRSYLAVLLGFMRPLEERLDTFDASFCLLGLDWAGRKRTRLLEQDLLALGHSAREVAAMEECAALPHLRSPAEALGCLYVLEGSTLGGQILLRTLGPRLGLEPEDGMRFLAGHGSKTGAQWKAFGAAVSRFEASGGDGAAAVAGAVATFEAQIDWTLRHPSALERRLG
jgi:heme oxygenase (biliverdin-IX-beta and delta-forming)